MTKKIIIKNSFFELLFFLFSLFLSFFRSIKTFFVFKKTKKNLFFDFLDYIFYVWPKYFWKKPSLYKVFSFPWDVINFLLKK